MFVCRLCDVLGKCLMLQTKMKQVLDCLRVIVRENQAKMEIFGMCDVTEFNEIWG